MDPVVDAVPLGEVGHDGELADELRASSRRLFPEQMVHRRLDGDRWVPCAPTETGHELDSRVHCYDREV